MQLSSVRANAGQRLVFRSKPKKVLQRGFLRIEARARRAGVGLLGTKAGMTTVFDKDGAAVPATVIGFESPNYVTQKLTTDKNGYSALQIGYQVVQPKKLTKQERCHLEKAGTPLLRHLVEFKVDDPDMIKDYEVGAELDLESLFQVDNLVDVAGTSIGKGFQGSIKRWGHHRGPMTHGVLILKVVN